MRRWGTLLNRRRNRDASETASPTTPPYVYKPLRDVDEIRLLSIGPRSETGQDGGPNLSIHRVQLSRSPLYAAVSYAWSHSHDKVNIQVDGQTLSIHHNLNKIIEQLRDDHQTRRVWIDAICINQKTLDERNHQVQLMGNIYNKANYVIACLTAERPHDCRRLQYEARELHRMLNKGATICTSSYRYFFGNRYFTRRWIIQEIGQAQTVIFCCEGYHIPMSILSRRLNDSTLQSKVGGSEDIPFLSEAERMAESRATQLFRIEPRGPKDLLTLEDLLYLHETAECYEFPDRIYALLSLTAQAKSHLVVEYNISRAQLLLSVLKICSNYEGLSSFRTLSFMCFLRQHLQVGMHDLRDGVLNLAAPLDSSTFIVQGTVHGRIQSLHTGAGVEEMAVRLRNENRLDVLTVYRPIRLKSTETNEAIAQLDMHLEMMESAAPTLLCHPISKTSGIDQCLFAFTGNQTVLAPRRVNGERDPPPTYEEARGPLLAGFASVRVEVGDEIWQFDRTYVAIVARKTLQGYDLVGRAFIMKDLNVGNYNFWLNRPPKPFEDDLLWVRDGRKFGRSTPTISLNYKGLYELMTWVMLG